MESKDTANSTNSDGLHATTEASLIKGMLSLENKNIIVDLQSKKSTWETLGVPDKIKENLYDLSFKRPSII
jgi:hypothetical protein